MSGLSGPKPSMRMRPGGGFNPMGSGLGSEHLDENASQQAGQSKSLTQQQADPSQVASQVQQQRAQQSAGNQQSLPKAPPPREIGTVGEELVRVGSDLAKEAKRVLFDFFSLSKWLGVDPQFLSDEEKAKYEQLPNRVNKLTEEQQQYAKKLYQQREERKKAQLEEEKRKKEMKAQQKAQPIQAPTSPKKGPVGLTGSRKQKATQQLQQNRKTLSQASGSN